MDIDEFLNTEAEKHKDLVSKGAEYFTDKTIEDQIIKVKELIRKKDFKEAEKVYFAVKDNFANLAKKQEEEKRKLHREINEINIELLESLNSLKLEMDKKTEIIKGLLAKAREGLKTGEVKKANQLYLEVRGVFKELPDAFAERKMEMENEILAFYSTLVNAFNKKSFDVLTKKTEEIHDHIDNSLGYIKDRKMDLAKKEFYEINRLYNELPDGFLYEKSILYKKILRLHKLIDMGVEGAAGEINIQKPTAPGEPAKIDTPPKKEEAPKIDAPPKEAPKIDSPPKPGEAPKIDSPPKPGEAPKIDAPPKKAEDAPKKKGFFGFLKKKPKEEKKIDTLPKQKEEKKEMDAPPSPSK